MKKKIAIVLLLALSLAGCNKDNSSLVEESSSFESSSSIVSSSETSSEVSSSTNVESSSVESSREYSSSVDVDTEKYPHAASLGLDREKPHNAYQVLVYSFFDSNNDGYGDLKGVEQKLDYIKDLGSDVIWLSPIMPSESYHAYDVVSFYDIDERLGTVEDFLSLVNEAHKKDMKILLDMPINHTSTNHEWFLKFANDDPAFSEYYQEYNPDVVNGTGSSMGTGTAKFYLHHNPVTGKYKSYYASFGKSMPDLNLQSETVVNAINDVFKYWVNLGADGFRFDAVKHVFDPNEIPADANSVEMNNAYFKKLRAYLKTLNEDIFLVGENYSGQGEVKLYAESFDSEFDFETWHTGLGAVTRQDPWGGSHPHRNFDNTLVGCSNELIGLNPEWVPTGMTGNHDVTRAASYIGSRVSDKDAALKLYAGIVTLRSGIPFIYYGDELGMMGENKSGANPKVGDAEVRLPMPFSDSTIDLEKMFYTEVNINGEISNLGANVKEDWPTYQTDNPTVDAQVADTNSLFNTYKSLLAVRNAHPALYKGKMEQVTDYNAVATIIKFSTADETVYVAYNFDNQPTTLDNITTGNVELLHTVNGVTLNGRSLEMNARGIAIFKATGEMKVIPDDPYSYKDVYIAGTMNNWSSNALKMSYKGNGIFEATNVPISSDTAQYKYVIDGNWYGAGYSDSNPDGNYHLSGSGMYTFKVRLTLNGDTVSINADNPVKTSEFDYEKVVYPSVWYLRGSMNNWGAPADYLFEPVDGQNGYFTITTELAAGDQFKVDDGTWGSAKDYTWLDASSPAYSNFKQAASDNNIECSVGGTYKITLDLRNNKIAVEKLA